MGKERQPVDILGKRGYHSGPFYKPYPYVRDELMTEKRNKRKLAAILSADVQGYSRLMTEDENATIATLKEYRDLMLELIARYNGRVVDSPGDNLMADFGSVVDAVESAVEIQKALRIRNAQLPEDRRMAFRMGINLGDVVEDEEEIYGDGVNIAARLESLAEGGGICVSGTVYDQVKNKVSFGFSYLGKKSVKNIEEPVRVYCVDLALDRDLRKTERNLKYPDRPSIAVLPFVNRSGDSEQEYFSDGLTEDIITDLSKISSLFVIASNSTFYYKKKSVKVREVAEELGVRYILEGSVRKGGNRVRITAQLIDAVTGGHLWAERYDRELTDIFDLQDEVTHQIVSALAVKLEEDEHKRLARKGTKNVDAYDHLLRGMENLDHLSKEACEDALRMFQKSVRLDPDYALAFALLAWTHLVQWMLGWTKDHASLEQSLQMAQKAVALDDSLAEAHWVLGNVYLWQKEYEKAILQLETAISINKNDADSYATLGNVLTWAGRLEEAVEMIKKAMRLNPYYPAWYLLRLGQAYSLMEQYDEAAALLKKALSRDPKIIPAHIFLAFVYSQTGRDTAAGAEIEALLKANPGYSQEILRETVPIKDKEKRALIMNALKKAGLK